MKILKATLRLSTLSRCLAAWLKCVSVDFSSFILLSIHCFSVICALVPLNSGKFSFPAHFWYSSSLFRLSSPVLHNFHILFSIFVSLGLHSTYSFTHLRNSVMLSYALLKSGNGNSNIYYSVFTSATSVYHFLKSYCSLPHFQYFSLLRWHGVDNCPI